MWGYFLDRTLLNITYNNLKFCISGLPIQDTSVIIALIKGIYIL